MTGMMRTEATVMPDMHGLGMGGTGVCRPILNAVLPGFSTRACTRNAIPAFFAGKMWTDANPRV
jgi:hypothetical protein